MTVVEVSVEIAPEFRDILIAELARYGYESFEETPNGVNAFCPSDVFNEEQIQELQLRYQDVFGFSYISQEHAPQNWNEEWEKNFPPLLIENTVSVRASFHPKPENVSYDIVINPKMSFGTGHHETTTLMLGYQLVVNHQGKKVLDMGCGTGILAIMAAKLGAAEVVAVDIEDWTVENALDNARINGFPEIDVRLGDISVVPGVALFDIVLANINRNVLLADMHRYAALVEEGGTLLLSGFYKEDCEILINEASKFGLRHSDTREMNRWCAMRFEK